MLPASCNEMLSRVTYWLLCALMWAGHFFSIVELFAEVLVAGGALDGALRAHSHSTLAAVCRNRTTENRMAALLVLMAPRSACCYACMGQLRCMSACLLEDASKAWLALLCDKRYMFVVVMYAGATKCKCACMIWQRVLSSYRPV